MKKEKEDIFMQKEYHQLSESEKRLIYLNKKIKEKPLSEILIHHGVLLTKDKGTEKTGYCPFHPDSNPGSFTVNDEKGICKCFSCGMGGDAIRFVELTQNLSHEKAIAQLACDEGIIGQTEFEILADAKYSDEFLNKETAETTFFRKKEKTSAYLKMANDVYSMFPMLFGLSKEDYDYLKNVRKLSDERIQTYFTIDEFDNDRFISLILKTYPEYKDNLKNLAGFYECKTEGKLEMAVPRGIGILIKNAKGEAVAVQVRKKNVKENERRYVWMTSSFAKSSDYCNGGESPGTPIDVLIPQNADIRKFAIVEGRFKSEILSKEGFISMSVQGVGNYSGIEKEIRNFPETETVFVFYDADMLSNTAVLNQAVKLGRYLKKECKNLNVRYCIWHEELGKGIDDLIFSGNKKDVKTISQEKFEEAVEKTLELLMEKYEITATCCKLSKEQRDTFNKELKVILTKELF